MGLGSYPQSVPGGVPGALYDTGNRRVTSIILVAAMAAGLVCLRDATYPDQGRPPADVDVADVDAIVASGLASTAGVQNITSTALNGVVGQGAMSPARNVTITLSNHADWDATTVVVTGTDEDGRVVQENLLLPNGGNATVSGVKAFRTVSNIYIPAQSGTGGTATVGFGSVLGAIDRLVHGVTVYDDTREPGVFAADRPAPVIQQGPVWMYSETAVDETSPVYVRFIATGGEVAGRVRGTPDANDCGLLRSAKFLKKTAGAGLVPVLLNLP